MRAGRRAQGRRGRDKEWGDENHHRHTKTQREMRALVVAWWGWALAGWVTPQLALASSYQAVLQSSLRRPQVHVYSI
jgi:hypothetical protein